MNSLNEITVNLYVANYRWLLTSVLPQLDEPTRRWIQRCLDADPVRLTAASAKVLAAADKYLSYSLEMGNDEQVIAGLELDILDSAAALRALQPTDEREPA